MSTSLATDLTERLLAHCSSMYETGLEAPLADEVEQRYRSVGAEVVRVGDSVVVRTADQGQATTVALVGHLDVVAPTDDDRSPRVESRDDGDVVVARGASDMKSGNVVAMRLVDEVLAGRLASPHRLALVLYAREEGAAQDNELAVVLDRVPWLAGVDLAVILEPTDGDVQLGCLGGLHATLTVVGRQAHSARPWQGHNALTRAAPLIAAIGAIDPREVVVEGISYRDVWALTQARTTNGRNLVPGSVELNLNYRFAPSRSLVDAETDVFATVSTLGNAAGVHDVGIEITDRAPPAPPHAQDEVVRAFVERVGADVTGKQAWTDVARFAELGVPALNFGPGRTDQAHQRGEYVEVAAMVDAYDRLASFLGPDA